MKLDLTGGAGLEAALFELKTATAKGVGRRVLIAAAEPVGERMADYAPEDTEDLSQSIEVSTRLNSNQRRETERPAPDEVRVHVGPSTGGDKDGSHGVYQEFGTVDNPPQPFARPAWEESKDQAWQDVEDGLRIEVAKSAERARRKAARG